MSVENIKVLREITGAGYMVCKRALCDADGNIDDAVKILRKSGAVSAKKKARREATEIVCAENEIYKVQSENENIPEKAKQKYLEGKIRKFYSEKCLLEQKYYRDSNFIVKDILNTCIAKIGENVVIKRFCRYEVG